MRGLVDDYVREEVLYREAKAMGLDQDDVIVRRRMRQKFEFLAEQVAAKSGAPSEQDLEAYLQQHPDKYREEPTFTFEHIFFSREKHGASTEVEARTVLARLGDSKDRAADARDTGRRLLIARAVREDSRWGDRTAVWREVRQATDHGRTGTWAGLLESSYGLHLVRVDERIPGGGATACERARIRPPGFTQRPAKQELDAQYAKLRARYAVTVEPPEAPRVAEAR